MENLLFTVIVFKESLLPVLNFLLLLNFLPHSQLQLRSEFPCKEKRGYLITLNNKEARTATLRCGRDSDGELQVAHGCTDPQPASPSTTAPLT